MSALPRLGQRDRERSVLLNKVISAQEDERQRIARELHDQIGQTLTGLVMQIGGVEATLGDDQVAIKNNFQTSANRPARPSRKSAG